MSEGYIELVDTMGGDLSVVNAARVSYGRRSLELDDKDRGVLRYMMEHKHGTPFEAAIMQFRVRCTIKEARDWFRYRFSSFNEYSTRYSPRIEDEYIPEPSAMRTQVGKPGRYTMVPITDPNVRQDIALEFESAYRDATLHYESLLKLGCAQELASMVYPLGQMTEFVWTVNLRALCNFLSQRMHETALYELRKKAYVVFARAVMFAPETMSQWAHFRQPDMMTDWNDDDMIWLPEELR